MCMSNVGVHFCLSPPSRGAWIEIRMFTVYKALSKVAPLAGGVD